MQTPNLPVNNLSALGLKLFGFIAVPSIFLVFWIFFKIGLVFFGGGYVVIPVMHRELVMNLHLLTEQEFIDGTAISQLTPGPVAILATFTGYRIAGVLGALVATFAMFLPGTVLMLFISKSYEKIKNSDLARRALNTIIPVIVGLLVAACWQLGKNAMDGWYDFAVFFVAFFLLIRFKTNPAILIIASALLGLFLHL